MKAIIAIDPGASGGIAVRYPNGKVTADAMPDTGGDIIEMLSAIERASGIETDSRGQVVCYLEDLVRFMGKTPMSHMAVYASNWGFLKGAIMALGIRLEVVRSQTWQKSLGIGNANSVGDRREWKLKLKGHAQQLFPGANVTMKTCDALLMLEWASKQGSAV